LQKTPAEIAELYKDLLISVTSFFRDPDTFEALVQHLAPALKQLTQRQEPLRIWVPGCATGEEVYSLAIRLHEFIEENGLSLALQIFGTDISNPALERARHGVYYDGIIETVSEARLRRFFVKTDGSYQINKLIRECCIFARHDVTRDAPFSRLGIISCRNLLIYLEPKAQRKVLPTFHYALNPGGVLMLGSAETTAAASDLFTVVDKTHRIFERKAVPTRLMFDLAAGTTAADFPGPPARVQAPEGTDFQKKLERIIQAKYSPDGVVVTGDLQILHFRGHTAPYLDPSPGDATFNLLRMVKEELVMAMRRAVQKAAESDMIVRDEGASLEMNGHVEQVRLEVTPIRIGDGPERYFFIVFSRSGTDVPPREPLPEAAPVERNAQAPEKELAETREYLRTVREEYEAHAEELRAANEEARSANEELQSTNEELGTTKEELQSANEELTTVNEELQHRNQELGNPNADLKNFLSAVIAAVIMVDQELRIRRFNIAAERLLELGAADIGRPIGHLRGQIPAPRLEDQINSVIETLHATSQEVKGFNDRWYSVSVRPYRTLDERIAGAVITFQDIDPLKRALERSEEAREHAEALIDTVREPLLVLDGDLRVQQATAAFYEAFLVSRAETEGRFLYDLGNGQWNRQRLRELLGRALFKNEPFHDFEVEHEFPHIGRRTMRLNGRRIPRRDPELRTLLLAIEDVTERREMAVIRFQRLFEAAKDGMVVIDAETEIVLDADPFFLSLTGFSREDMVGKSIADAGALLRLEHTEGLTKELQKTEMVRYDDLQLTTRSGGVVRVDVVANRYLVGAQPGGRAGCRRAF